MDRLKELIKYKSLQVHKTPYSMVGMLIGVEAARCFNLIANSSLFPEKVLLMLKIVFYPSDLGHGSGGRVHTFSGLCREVQPKKVHPLREEKRDAEICRCNSNQKGIHSVLYACHVIFFIQLS